MKPGDPGSRFTYQGQYISAGYTGHGMPRAFAWYVFTCAFSYVLVADPLGSAEAVSGMIYADMTQQKWSAPDWFPLHYLTAQDV